MKAISGDQGCVESCSEAADGGAKGEAVGGEVKCLALPSDWWSNGDQKSVESFCG